MDRRTFLRGFLGCLAAAPSSVAAEVDLAKVESDWSALSGARMIRTTNGTIAFANLAAHIDGLELYAASVQRLTSRSWAELVDLLILRAHMLGRIADYERALALAELRLRKASADGLSYLSLARARGSLHLFKEALRDLDVAERLGIENP